MKKILAFSSLLAAPLVIALPAVVVPHIVLVALIAADFTIFGPPLNITVAPLVTIGIALAAAALIADQLQVVDPRTIGLIAL
jgi:hypothetical protein